MSTSEAAALIERLSAVDVRAAVHCACSGMEAALHLVPAGEDAPARVTELARAWLRGEATADDAGRLLFEVERAWGGFSPGADLCLASYALARALQRPEAQTAGPLLAQSVHRLLMALDWNDPVQRAVAERTADEALVRQILGRP